MKVAESGVKGSPKLHSKFKVTFAYMISYIKRTRPKMKQNKEVCIEMKLFKTFERRILKVTKNIVKKRYSI